MANKNMTNGSLGLYPDGSVLTTEDGSEFQITAGADFDCYFDVDKSAPRYTLQAKYASVDGSGTITLYNTVNGTDYDNVVDDNGDNVTITVTGANASTTINNVIPQYGKVKVNYAKGTNTDGYIALNVRQ